MGSVGDDAAFDWSAQQVRPIVAPGGASFPLTPPATIPACARYGTEFTAILRACGGLFSRVVDYLRSASLEIQKSALIGHSAGDMFDLIEAAEHYPTFLPWCAKAAILARDEGG